MIKLNIFHILACLVAFLPVATFATMPVPQLPCPTFEPTDSTEIVKVGLLTLPRSFLLNGGSKGRCANSLKPIISFTLPKYHSLGELWVGLDKHYPNNQKKKSHRHYIYSDYDIYNAEEKMLGRFSFNVAELVDLSKVRKGGGFWNNSMLTLGFSLDMAMPYEECIKKLSPKALEQENGEALLRHTCKGAAQLHKSYEQIIRDEHPKFILIKAKLYLKFHKLQNGITIDRPARNRIRKMVSDWLL